MKHDRGGRVAVELSGGVDSAAAACILKDRGFELLALTMHTSAFEKGGGETLSAARSVAEALGIDHEIVDVEDSFASLVIQPFLETYINGETPNPCVACNRYIKFGVMMQEAQRRGCDLLATGHYARIEATGKGPCRVLRGEDRGKDQTYVLWTLDQATLGRVLFPLERLTKGEAAAVARDAGVRYTAPESQDVCFLNGNAYAGLVAAGAPESIRPGPVVNAQGVTIGTHRGLPFYTVGQRRGLGIGGSSAMYVLEIDPVRNTLVVGDRSLLAVEEFGVRASNFISGRPPSHRFECHVETRYRGSSMPAVVEIQDDGLLTVRYLEPGPPAAPGQSAVFYSGDELLGGGIIVRQRPGRV